LFIYLFKKDFPKIDPFAFQPSININTPIVLVTCMVSSGDKPLSFEWLKDGRAIHTSPDNRLTIRNGETYSILELKDLHQDDIGNYTCIAKNSHGSDQFTSPFIIKSE
jgi:cell adhesion molecule, putative (fragment)